MVAVWKEAIDLYWGELDFGEKEEEKIIKLLGIFWGDEVEMVYEKMGVV